MNRKQMLARLKKGEDPLELSIEKWQDIVDGKGRDYGYKNCALCETYFECKGCPIDTGRQPFGCWGTPYDNYQYANSTRARREAASKELEFLKSLRKNKP